MVEEADESDRRRAEVLQWGVDTLDEEEAKPETAEEVVLAGGTPT